MARPSNTQERRTQITSAFRQVMAARGYDGASITEVGQVAGLAPGLVHYHFKNKREILLAMLDELVTRRDALLTARLAKTSLDASAQMTAFLDFYLGLGADSDPESLACWILLSGEAIKDEQVREPFARALGRSVALLADILRAGVEQRSFECESVEAAASALVATVQGYFLLAATAPGVVPRGSAATAAQHMADGLLRRPSAPRASRGRK